MDRAFCFPRGVRRAHAGEGPRAPRSAAGGGAWWGAPQRKRVALARWVGTQACVARGQIATPMTPVLG